MGYNSVLMRKEYSVGYNTKHFDHEHYYASRSTKELQNLLKEAQEFVDKYPQFERGRHNEYLQLLKLKIAERIGKKKQ